MSFTCPDCGRTSYHPEDEANSYCGHCHTFHDTIFVQTHPPKKKLPWTYWPITLVAFFFFALAGAVVTEAIIGLNPYIGFSLTWGGLVIWEAVKLKKDGY